MDESLSLSQNIDTLFSNIENFTQTEGVMGKPVTQQDKTFIPVVSVSIGCGGGNTASRNHMGKAETKVPDTSANMAGGALGLGAKVSTDAIIVIDNGKVSLMTVNAAGNASQLIDKIPDMVKGITGQHQGQNQQQQNQNQK